MNSSNPKKPDANPNAATDKEEENLRAAITVGLDGGEGKRYQAVDEFSDEFLMQQSAARK